MEMGVQVQKVEGGLCARSFWFQGLILVTEC